MPRPIPIKCLVPKCDKRPAARGLCHDHYSFAKRLIKKKQTTWDKLVASGKALPLKSNPELEAWFLSNNELDRKTSPESKEAKETKT